MFTLYPDKQVGHEVFDDFDYLSMNTSGASAWQVVKGTGGTLAIASQANGWLSVPTAASANDYQLIATTNKVFQFQPGKALYLEALVNCTEANTNKANLVIGVSSITTTGFLTTGSGGPPTTFDGAVIWKQGGTLEWQFTSSASTTQNVNTTVAPFVSATNYRVGFLFDPGDGTTGYVTPFVNGVPPIYQTKPKSHPIVYGSTGQLYGIFGVNCGSSSAETLTIDYFRVVQFR